LLWLLRARLYRSPAHQGSYDRDCSGLGFLLHLLEEKISWLGYAIQIIIDIVVGYGQDLTIGDEHRSGINNPLANGRSLKGRSG